VLILVNGNASSGKSAGRWKKAEAALRAGGRAFAVEETRSVDEAERVVAHALERGEDALVAAGGDGTVNSLLNALMDPARDRPRADVALGAIGLGSSNDFHKPFAQERALAKLPARVVPERARAVDVGKAVLRTADGATRTRYFILNASVGIVAAGNAFFNTDDPTLVWLKRRNTELAILYTAWVNIRRFRTIEISIALDERPTEKVPLTALGILKSVHFAGGMRYDTPVTADDGQFDVNVWEPMGKWGILGTMLALYRGKFIGRKRTRAERARRVCIESPTPIDFELDGEVSPVVAAELSVLPKVIRICG
jgi:diacylglycerol kinase family enzyme